jgi:hypothetical protein
VSALAPVVQWVTAPPLWPAAAESPDAMQRPVLLRFTSDSFMDELQGLLGEAPTTLANYRALAQSYRAKPPGAAPSWVATLPNVKLYQAAHGQFNLVAASLVCRLAGLPDRTLDTSADETVGFVLRRVVAGSEAAWATEPTSTTRGWRSVPRDAEKRLATGEEVLPLLPVRYDTQPSRRLLVGLIPTSSSDTFKAGPELSPFVAPLDADGNPVDSRIDDFETRVLRPLQDLKTSGSPAAVRTEASQFLLVDFAELLTTHLPSEGAALGASSAPGFGTARELYVLLDDAVAGTTPESTFREALVRAWGQRLRIVGEALPASDLAVDLKASDLDPRLLRPILQRALRGLRPETEFAGSIAEMQGEGEIRPQLEAERTSRLRSRGERPVVTDAAVPKLDPAGQALYVVRCVFRRPRCVPPVDLLSEPSDRFAIASFFDSDAPARPIRVQLPIKTSIADLRKYPKNVGFVLSNELQQQMSRVTDLKSVMAGQLAAGDEIDVGMLCSFSIPIITICALIVLMVFLSLLNIVFWWMPFVRTCLPIAVRGDGS